MLGGEKESKQAGRADEVNENRTSMYFVNLLRI